MRRFDKIAGSNFEHQRFFADGPKGVGQEARSNPAEHVFVFSKSYNFDKKLKIYNWAVAKR